MVDARRVIACLADPRRLRVYSEIVLAGQAGIDVLWISEPDASKHLASLVEVGLVAVSDDRQRLRPADGVFRAVLEQLPPPEPREPEVSIPRKHTDRLEFLRTLADDLFESGAIYHERTVDEALRTVHTDPTTLRRYLVDYGFLDRTADGTSYWLVPERWRSCR